MDKQITGQNTVHFDLLGLLQSLESTRRMVKLCDECVEAGGKTADMLAEQGEQLDRIQNGMVHIDQDMKRAEKNLEDLERCCGLFVLPWKRAKQFEKSGDYTNTWKSSDDGKVNTIGPRVGAGDPSGEKATGGFITRITNDAREDEMDRNLGEVDDMVGVLHNMAVDIGNELDSQNVQLAEMNEKVSLLETQRHAISLQEALMQRTQLADRIMLEAEKERRQERESWEEQKTEMQSRFNATTEMYRSLAAQHKSLRQSTTKLATQLKELYVENADLMKVLQQTEAKHIATQRKNRKLQLQCQAWHDSVYRMLHNKQDSQDPVR